MTEIQSTLLMICCFSSEWSYQLHRLAKHFLSLIVQGLFWWRNLKHKTRLIEALGIQLNVSNHCRFEYSTIRSEVLKNLRVQRFLIKIFDTLIKGSLFSTAADYLWLPCNRYIENCSSLVVWFHITLRQLRNYNCRSNYRFRF